MSRAITQSVWVIDDDQSIRWVLNRTLTNAGFKVTAFETAASALTRFKRSASTDRPRVILTDLRMPGIGGFDFLKQIRNVDHALPIIIMTAYSDLDTTVQAYQQGAFEYLPKPFDIDEVIDLVSRACQKQPVASTSEGPSGFSDEIIGDSPAIQEVFRIIGRLSRSDTSVLISGEPGTGKELVARAIHRHSPRKNGPFIAINTAAIPAELLESGLFGHEKGAFTGAQSQHKGRFEQAQEGTLFLDEIGDMPLNMQVKILRVLQEKSFERVGGVRTIQTDVRILAATHNDLERMIEAGEFRQDLYYRINVFPIEMPPLRERSEDIPLLLNELITNMESEKRGSVRFNSSAIASMCRHDWPGNVRELANLVERMANLYPHGIVGVNDLPEKYRHLLEQDGNESPLARGQGHSGSVVVQGKVMLDKKFTEQGGDDSLLPVNGLDLKEYLANLEKDLIAQALNDSGGVVARAADRLHVGRTTLVEKMRRYSLQKKQGDEPQGDECESKGSEQEESTDPLMKNAN